MQIWNFFLFFALAAILFWALGAFFSWKGKKALAVGATVAGLVVFLSYIIVLWTALDRPPMRTMGETRLWYSLFLPLMGLIVYSRWNYKWYALLGAAFVMAVYLLFFHHHEAPSDKEWTITDNLVYVGWAFLTLGMLSGALWAKMAWGNYWAWDPKETWAAATWLAYLVYIHYRLRRQSNMRFALWVLIVNFALLQMCWWGINYLPSAQGTSVHTYYMN